MGVTLLIRCFKDNEVATVDVDTELTQEDLDYFDKQSLVSLVEGAARKRHDDGARSVLVKWCSNVWSRGRPNYITVKGVADGEEFSDEVFVYAD